ncbi:hypothetical protein U0D62_20770 [Aquimarina sp. 2201CG5-10]|nr:hypothetical protein [Aquimarina sp. 2201CG5-10]
MKNLLSKRHFVTNGFFPKTFLSRMETYLHNKLTLVKYQKVQLEK